MPVEDADLTAAVGRLRRLLSVPAVAAVEITRSSVDRLGR
jgi:hypothetical protein